MDGATRKTTRADLEHREDCRFCGAELGARLSLWECGEHSYIECKACGRSSRFYARDPRPMAAWVRWDHTSGVDGPPPPPCPEWAKDPEAFIPAGLLPSLPKAPTDSPVDHPPHYNAGEIECIDAIREGLGAQGFIDYCRGNAIKYLWRCRYKGRLAEDLSKAAWYCKRAAEVAEAEGESA